MLLYPKKGDSFSTKVLAAPGLFSHLQRGNYALKWGEKGGEYGEEGISENTEVS